MDSGHGQSSSAGHATHPSRETIERARQREEAGRQLNSQMSDIESDEMLSRLGADVDVATSTMYALHHQREMFSDVIIECSDRKHVHAHKAVLATKEKFFAVRFFPQTVVQKVKGMQPIKKAHRALFTEESAVLRPILEYIYTGVIDALEKAPQDLDQPSASLWLKVLTWCYRNELSVYNYVHDSLLRHTLPVQVAADVLALVADTDGAREYCSQYRQFMSSSVEISSDDIGNQKNTAMLELKQLALTTFVNHPMTPEIFLPLSREALKTVLSQAFLNSPEVDVCLAVQLWTKVSPWVQANCENGYLAKEHMHDIISLLDVSCLSFTEFLRVDSMFPLAICLDVMKANAARRRDPQAGSDREGGAVCSSRGRMSSSNTFSSTRLMSLGEMRREKTLANLQREVLQLREACDIQGDKMRPAQSQDMSYNRTQPIMSSGVRAPRESDTNQMGSEMSNMYVSAELGTTDPQPLDQRRAPFNAPPSNVASTGNRAPRAGIDPTQRDAVIDAARSDPNDDTSAFMAGPGLVLQAQTKYVTLVSSDATRQQGLLYKGGVQDGCMRFSLEVIRPCDVLWMGVSATHLLDMAQWIARDPEVYMVSEDNSCLAHCRDVAVLQEDSHAVYIGFTKLPCVRCLKNDPTIDGWSKVIVDLDATTGDMWMEVNGTERQHVFQNLPTDRPLYPVVSAINAAQVKFHHMLADET